MARAKKKDSGEQHHGLLAAVEQQYLAALRFSRDQLNQKIAAVESLLGGGNNAAAAKVKWTSGGQGKQKSAKETRKPRNYDVLKAKITKPMTMLEMLKVLGMKEKQEGTLRQTMQNYPGLFKSDGKRPATYTLDTSR